MDKKPMEMNWASVAKASAIGAGGSMIVSLVLTAIGAALVNRESIEEGSLNAVAAAVLMLSSVCGSLLAASVVGHHRLLVCIASGAAYFLLLYSCAILLFDGANSSAGVTALMVLGGAAAAALMGLKDGKRRVGYRRTKKRNWKVVQNSQRGN